jgi:lytic cellulose monooxygenase (C1-hydroxylating)
MKSFACLVFLSSTASVMGHATFQQLWVNSEDMESTCIRMPKNNSPVTNVMSNDMRCNASPSPAAGVCEAAGSSFPLEGHRE